MEFIFETTYNQKALTTMAKGVRKTARKKRTKRSHIFGWIVIALAHALKLGKITMGAILAKANQDVSDGVIDELVYKDGGSQVYKYPDYTIVKYHIYLCL